MLRIGLRFSIFIISNRGWVGFSGGYNLVYHQSQASTSNLYSMITSIPIPQRVLVIGGGPTGLVALRNLLERGKFEHVELWERRDDIGGVW